MSDHVPSGVLTVLPPAPPLPPLPGGGPGPERPPGSRRLRVHAGQSLVFSLIRNKSRALQEFMVRIMEFVGWFIATFIFKTE